MLLYSGKTGELLLTMEADQPRRMAGVSVSRAGDWNGDGIEDVVAGAPGLVILQTTNHFSGAYVFSGADGSILHFFDGESYCDKNSAFGFCVSSGMDVNGDGTPDLLVGAPMEPYNSGPTTSQTGAAFLFSGATGQLLWAHRGPQAGMNAGFQASLIGDHDSDGFADWMLSAPDYDADPSSCCALNGRLTLFAGAPGDVQALCSGGPNSLTSGAKLWNSGSIGLRANALELVVSEMPGSTAVIFVQGRRTAQPQPFGVGELCIAGPLSILGVGTTGYSWPPGTPMQASIGVDLSTAPFSDGGEFLQPGDTWAFQALYRDQDVRNTSNALGVVFLP